MEIEWEKDNRKGYQGKTLSLFFMKRIGDFFTDFFGDVSQNNVIPILGTFYSITLTTESQGTGDDLN